MLFIKRVILILSAGLMVIIGSFSLVFSVEDIESGSLSELNFNMEDSLFLKDIPWPQKDPFVPPLFEIENEVAPERREDIIEVVEEIEPPDLNLNAIFYSNLSQSAVVDGQIVRVGSVIKDQTVIKINNNSITVDFNGKDYKIELKDFTITK